MPRPRLLGEAGLARSIASINKKEAELNARLDRHVNGTAPHTAKRAKMYTDTTHLKSSTIANMIGKMLDTVKMPIPQQYVAEVNRLRDLREDYRYGASPSEAPAQQEEQIQREPIPTAAGSYIPIPYDVNLVDTKSVTINVRNPDSQVPGYFPKETVLNIAIMKRVNVGGVNVEYYFAMPYTEEQASHLRSITSRQQVQKSTYQFSSPSAWPNTLVSLMSDAIKAFLTNHQAARVHIEPTSLFEKSDGEYRLATDTNVGVSHSISRLGVPRTLLRKYRAELDSNGMGKSLNGSGWSFRNLYYIKMSLTGMNAMAGRGFFRHCCPGHDVSYNLQNTDSYCSLYAIAEHFFPRPEGSVQRKRKDKTALVPQIVFGELSTDTSTKKKHKTPAIRIHADVGKALLTVEEYVQKKYPQDPTKMQEYTVLGDKFLHAKNYIDKSREEADVDGLDVLNLSYLEKLFSIRILCLGTSMMVKDEDQPLYAKHCINRDRYTIEPVNCLYKPQVSEEHVDDPLVVLYYIQTDETDTRIYETNAERGKEGRDSEKEGRKKKPIRPGTIAKEYLTTGIRSHFLYVPSEDAGSLCRQLKGNNYAKMCRRCFTVLTHSRTKDGKRVSVTDALYNHHAKCMTLPPHVIKQMWDDNLEFRPLVFGSKYVTLSNSHSITPQRYMIVADIEAILKDVGDGVRSHIPSVLRASLIDTYPDGEEPTCDTVTFRGTPTQIMNGFFEQLNTWQAKRQGMDKPMVFCKNGLVCNKYGVPLPSDVCTEAARQYAQEHPDLDQIALYVEDEYHITRAAYLKAKAVEEPDQELIETLAEQLRQFKCATCCSIRPKNEPEQPPRVRVPGEERILDAVSQFDDDEEEHTCTNTGLDNVERCKLVVDHDHTTGLIRGLVCVRCNARARSSQKVPIFFHNSTRYDMKHILRYVDNPEMELSNPVLKSSEQVSTITYRKVFRFLDSLSFIPDSLANLVKDHHKPVAAEGANHRPLARVWPLTLQWLKKEYSAINLTEEQLLTIVKSKGEFSYEWYDSEERDEEEELPDAIHFKGGEEVRARALTIWNMLGMTKFSQYVDFYCGLDVMQLSDILLQFKDNFIKAYGRDPYQYSGIAGAAFDVSLDAIHEKLHGEYLQWIGMDDPKTHPLHRYFKARDGYARPAATFAPEIPQDPEMYSFIVGDSKTPSAIRGGFSAVVAQRYMKRDDHHRMYYVDWKSQYPTCMKNPLPLGCFEWVQEQELDTLLTTIVPTLTQSSIDGYMIEVDMYLPSNLHDKFSRYPLFQENARVSQVSPYTHDVLHTNDTKFKPATKLIGRLDSVSNYKIAGFRLAQMIRMGAIVTKVHRAMKFLCYDYLSDFMENGFERRKLVKNTPMGNVIKITLNSVYGKWLQRDDQFSKYQMVTGEGRDKKLIKLAGNNRFKRYVHISETIGFAEIGQKNNTVRRPHIVGAYILEHAKYMMTELMYDTLYPVFEDNITCLYTDTDSMLLAVDTETEGPLQGDEQDDCYFWRKLHESPHDETQSKLERWFHLGNISLKTEGWDFIPEEMQRYIDLTKNNNRLGCLGLEEMSSGVPEPIEEFVGLRSKMYSLISVSGAKKQKCKGVPKGLSTHDNYKSILGVDIDEEDYDEVFTFPHRTISEATNQKVEIRAKFQSKNMGIKSSAVTKTSLSAVYDKAYVCRDGITCVPWGYNGSKYMGILRTEHDEYAKIREFLLEQSAGPVVTPGIVKNEDGTMKTCC